MNPQTIFRSFFQAGFECSTHYPPNRRRLDMIAATRHDVFAQQDYARLREYGLLTTREGIRWHLIEQQPYRYDWSSVLPILRAARDNEVQVIWDIMHFGWPYDLDIFSPEFVRRYVALARAFAHVVAEETDEVPFFTPVNEISFFAWAGATVAYISPFVHGRGGELKEQLVRATIEGMDAIWAISPRARFVHADPFVHVAHDPHRRQDAHEAAIQNGGVLEAWDMIAGRVAPHLGGNIKYLDIIGINFYPHNQRLIHPPMTIWRSHPRYRHLRSILLEVWQRYGRPIYLSETGADGERRAGWLSYVGTEARAAMRQGVQFEGICLYPIVNFPWWDDDHKLHNALWDYADDEGNREVYQPLADELRRQQRIFKLQSDLSPVVVPELAGVL